TEMTLKGPFGVDKTLLRGDHHMKALGFTLWSYHARIDFPQALSDVIGLDVRAQLSTDALPPGAAFKVPFARQDFNIPSGAMIMDAIAKLVFMTKAATDLASFLNVLINCGDVANWLGNRCVLGLCVKDIVSTGSIKDFCTGGLNTLGFVVETAVRSLKLDLIRAHKGHCTLHDKGSAGNTPRGKA